MSWKNYQAAFWGWGSGGLGRWFEQSPKVNKLFLYELLPKGCVINPLIFSFAKFSFSFSSFPFHIPSVSPFYATSSIGWSGIDMVVPVLLELHTFSSSFIYFLAAFPFSLSRCREALILWLPWGGFNNQPHSSLNMGRTMYKCNTLYNTIIHNTLYFKNLNLSEVLRQYQPIYLIIFCGTYIL